MVCEPDTFIVVAASKQTEWGKNVMALPAVPAPGNLLSGNKLLSELDQRAVSRLSNHIYSVLLKSQEVLSQPGKKLTHVFFPTTALLGSFTFMEDGHTISSMTPVGNEGAWWIAAIFGAYNLPFQTVASLPGHAFKIEVKYLRTEINVNPYFRQVLVDYQHVHQVTTMRTAACNGLHSLHQRCAKWMLTALDATGSTEFSITHEFVASVLGASRPTISEIINDFQRMNVISLSRAHVTVRNRVALERLTCECYAFIKRIPFEVQSGEKCF